MPETSYPRHHVRLRDDTKAPFASVARLIYLYEHYRRSDDAIAGMRAQLVEGWRIVQIRGPVNGPFEVDYLREVRRVR